MDQIVAGHCFEQIFTYNKRYFKSYKNNNSSQVADPGPSKPTTAKGETWLLHVLLVLLHILTESIPLIHAEYHHNHTHSPPFPLYFLVTTDHNLAALLINLRYYLWIANGINVLGSEAHLQHLAIISLKSNCSCLLA